MSTFMMFTPHHLLFRWQNQGGWSRPGHVGNAGARSSAHRVWVGKSEGNSPRNWQEIIIKRFLKRNGRGFWTRETGTGQHVAQLHERCMMMKEDWRLWHRFIRFRIGERRNDFHKCLQHLYRPWRKCIVVNGDYFEEF
jgi:hypothetical protein